MSRKSVISRKKLIGVLKHCIQVCEFNKNTKAFRNKLEYRINKLSVK